jgi:hypothetical protein
VFVTLFNLQGAHRSQRREFILPHRFHLVKNFFQVFQPFVLSDAPAGYSLFACRLSRRLAYCITSFSLCQELFSGIFQPVLFSHSEPLFRSVPSAVGQLRYVTTPILDCQALFSIFSTFSFSLFPLAELPPHLPAVLLFDIVGPALN